MKVLTILMTLGLLLACKEGQKRAATNTASPVSTPVRGDNPYPQNLQKVFKAHGGLDHWRRYRTLSFRIPRDASFESHTIDLYSRKDRIEGSGYALGFDGSRVWLDDPEKGFEGNPEFYHNLMFYFYAMPFVLADDGIQYGPADPITFRGTTYPGIRIGYRDGVGSSPKDNYYLHFDPVSHRMSWLGYTVTFFDDTPSEDINWVRYNDWQEVSGLQLPGSIAWYKGEGQTIKDKQHSVSFEGIALSEEAQEDGFYDPPEGASFEGDNQ